MIGLFMNIKAKIYF